MPFSTPWSLPDLGIELASPVCLSSVLQMDFLVLSRWGSPACCSGLVKISFPSVEKKELAVPLLGFFRVICREGSGTPLQYSCLENPMGGGAWWAAVHGVAKSWTRLSDFTFTFHLHFSLSYAGEGNGTPLQYSCLENSMGGGAWWATVHGVAKSRTRLSDFTFTFHLLYDLY